MGIVKDIIGIPKNYHRLRHKGYMRIIEAIIGVPQRYYILLLMLCISVATCILIAIRAVISAVVVRSATATGSLPLFFL